MSYLAIGAVTKALVELLSRKLNKPPLLDAVTFRVTTLPPDDDRVSEDTGVNLFLYRLTESEFLKNAPWPGDQSSPNGSTRPPLALNLNYLLTGYAKKVAGSAQDDIAAHQLLGNAMSILHDYPVLNDIHDGDFDADVDAQFAAELQQSFEKVKVSLLPMSMDEFSKIWTGFSKAYRLSVAYEVSLVQIAPLAPVALQSPHPQRVCVRVNPLGQPSVASIDPPSGPVGAKVKLTGDKFTLPGQTTSVTVGGVTLGPGELDRLTTSEIVLTVPPGLAQGPQTSVTVSCGGFSSAPVTYEVEPWLTGLEPLRGITGIPISIPFEVPAGTTVAVEIDGLAAVTAVDAPNKLVRAIVPLEIASNGPKPVVLTLDDGTPKRSNTLLYEVMPAISSFTQTDGGAPARTTIAVTGERLRGIDVHLRYDKLVARVGDTRDPVRFPAGDTNVSFQFDRVLVPGGTVSLLVDARPSNALPRVLGSLNPPQGVSGDQLALTGSSLSGRDVVVTFGAVALPAVAQPFAHRFTVTVPAALAPGPTTVGVAVDGSSTNALPFLVLTT
jgi:hypothetical protein